MRTSERGIDLIKRFEGCELEAYHDAVGYPTQGYGRLLSREKWADLSRWPAITEEEADAWLRMDVEKHARAVHRLVPVPLKQGQFDALTSFTFNLGAGALQASTLRRVLKRGDYDEAPRQLMCWVYAGGRKLRGLVRRREAEVILGMLWEEP